MTTSDLLLVAFGAFMTAWVLKRIQGGPVKGHASLLDLIAPKQDPYDRVYSLTLSIITPVVAGLVISFFAGDKVLAAALAPGLGALLSVSVVFIRPDTLAPPIRDNLRLAQFIYFGLVLGYIGLGALPAIVVLFAKYLKAGDIVNGLATQVIYAIIAAVLLIIKKIAFSNIVRLTPSDLIKGESGFEGVSRSLAEASPAIPESHLKEESTQLDVTDEMENFRKAMREIHSSYIQEGRTEMADENIEYFRQIVREEVRKILREEIASLRDLVKGLSESAASYSPTGQETTKIEGRKASYGYNRFRFGVKYPGYFS